MSNENDIISNIEEALKVVDNSNLPPAPTGERQFPGRVSDSARRPTPPVNTPARPGATKKSGLASKLISSPSSKSASSTSPGRKSPGTVIKTEGGLNDRPVSFLSDEDVVKHREAENDLDIGSPDFKMKFDFDSAYKDVPEDKPFRLRREKRTGLVGGLLLAIFIICVSVVVAAVVWMATVDILGFATEDEQINVQVPIGFTLEGVTDMLYEAGLIRHKALFMWYADFSNAMDKITEGSYVLNKNYDYRALVQGMTARAGTRVETSVTIPEGFTMAQIFSLLEAEGVCPAEELWHAATFHDFNFFFLDRETLGSRLRLEGFLFPDTYNFYMDSTPIQALNRMLREFGRRFTEEYIERADELGYSVHEIIIIASLIEREAGGDEERPRIAAVIYNRLRSSNFPFLQIDATINYAIAGTTIPFSTQLDSPFNSYTHEGLPPGAIASPGMPSIRAALFPDETNEYFYALNRYGTHNFFTNFTDHVNFVNSDAYGG